MIHLSPAAIAELCRLRDRHPANLSFCRLAVRPGGCADFHYHLSFEDHANPSDHILEFEAIQILIDNQSMAYISELTLDYTEDLMGGGFRFHNSKAVRTCGCSHSFAVKEP
jgi:iron-sulfur cluster assembly accessory protein